jgi:hypothetical protein
MDFDFTGGKGFLTWDSFPPPLQCSPSLRSLGLNWWLRFNGVAFQGWGRFEFIVIVANSEEQHRMFCDWQLHHLPIIYKSHFFFFFFFLVVLGFELRALHLLGKLSTTSATNPDLLLLVFFQMGSCAFSQANLGPWSTSSAAGMTGLHHHSSLVSNIHSS